MKMIRLELVIDYCCCLFLGGLEETQLLALWDRSGTCLVGSVGGELFQ